ncbi:class I tRNA ligase family protein [Candidatus Parcubacteria bacterium]|nr:class I tRNA ligase family protein [Candidatus Parcubacteria bacterium]
MRRGKYEGPPTANAKPALHHLESRAFKDAIPRYKTMRGYHVPRKAGWDTHGLPVELQIEKKLGFKSKKDIEAYGIEKFNKECKESVFEYIGEWEKFTDRIGYWVDLKDAYYTFNNSYIESVWEVIAHTDKRNLLYKDYKVVPWCPRCGTALSSHELAQGYQDVKDISLYVKFKIKSEENTYLLAWTTTPWTLPGNLALAVNPNTNYRRVKFLNDFKNFKKGETYIAGENFLALEIRGIPEWFDDDKTPFPRESSIFIGGETGKFLDYGYHKGSNLVGLAYEPLFHLHHIDAYLAEANQKVFKVYSADFVNTEEGTGIVHTAVMYGQDDFELGTKIGLPKNHLVDDTGHFKQNIGFLTGMSVIDESTAVEILKDLQSRGLLYRKESHQHSYPFCWRCGTRLIYYARDSWYIRMSSLRDELVKENEKINWEPEHIKEGRFGEWLREVKDWAISRERYWGTPLPVWLSTSGESIVVDSLETLKRYVKKSGNKYFVMRHGEAVDNAKNVLDPKGDPNNHLTERGRQEIQATALSLKSAKIDLVFASPFIRTRETAEAIRAYLALPVEAVIIDDRLHEFNESDQKLVRERIGDFLFDLERSHSGKNILIISHGNPIWVMEQIAEWHSSEGFNRKNMLQTAEVRELPFTPFPRNENYELDLHKPYIDEVILEKDGKEYKRAKEVMDVWLDSGSMPFAQSASWRTGKIAYPADYISEAIDQTRGWFYTLHAVGTLMERGRAFSNAICLGHILDTEGRKMSKSVGNIIEPFSAIEKYGVDTLRLWMYSVNQPGESKNFDERTVDEVNKRIFNLLDNVYAFYELYRDKKLENNDYPGSKHVLDKWILSKLSVLIGDMTQNIDNYRLLEPVRGLREFINDLSTWYLRRSRDRLKDGNADAKKTLYYVLKTVSKLLAPFAPFAADELYQKLRITSDPESVHLESWPRTTSSFFALYPAWLGSDASKKSEVMQAMDQVRKIVSLTLEARSKSNLKIRQPLSRLEVKDLKLGKEYLELIKDEVNVKEVIENKKLEDEIAIDTNITPELEEEGRVREVIRNIQEIRKQKNLRPSDRMEFEVPGEEREFYEKHKKEIESATNTALVIK